MCLNEGDDVNTLSNDDTEYQLRRRQVCTQAGYDLQQVLLWYSHLYMLNCIYLYVLCIPVRSSFMDILIRGLTYGINQFLTAYFRPNPV